MSGRSALSSAVAHLIGDGDDDDALDADLGLDIDEDYFEALAEADDDELADADDQDDGAYADDEVDAARRRALDALTPAELRRDNPFIDEDLQLLESARANIGATNYRQPLKRAANERRYNFGIRTVLDVIRAPLYAPDDWIWQRGAARQVCDEDARAHQLILRQTLPRTSDRVPRRGDQRVVVPPRSLADVRFQRWMHQTTPRLWTTNVVSTFHLGNGIQLPELCRALAGVYANPRCFAAVKLTCDTATHLIFPGGSVVCPGASPLESARLACLNCTELLQRARFMVEFSHFTIQNVVSTAVAGFEINLRALARAYPLNAHYNPDCFPGLTFRTHTSQLVITVFKTGCCIIAGVTSRTDSLVAWRWFHSYILWQFEMHNGEAYTTEADYRRKTRSENSIVDSVCESLRDMTQAHVAKLLAQDNQLAELHSLYHRPEIADEYYLGVRRVTETIGAGKPVLTLDDFLAGLNSEKT